MWYKVKVSAIYLRKGLQELSPPGNTAVVYIYIIASNIYIHALLYIYGTKFIIEHRSRDHVGLLLSTKHWPVVYAVDVVCDVAHTEAHLR